MQPLPRTPSKADDGIESVKQSLSVKWGIQLPRRGSVWSPSHRDPKRLEEKICTFIQLLYFRGGALDLAISSFEENAVHIYSEWQYKPRAETDVLPNRQLSVDTPDETFLLKRTELPKNATNLLTETLLHHLTLVVTRVKNGESFPGPNHFTSEAIIPVLLLDH